MSNDRQESRGRALGRAATDRPQVGPSMRAERILGTLGGIGVEDTHSEHPSVASGGDGPEIGAGTTLKLSGSGKVEPVTPLLPPRGLKEARALPDHPLGDPEGGWREPSRVLFAVMEDGWQAKDGHDLLRHCDAAELLDLYFSASEWVIATHPDPAVRAFGWRMAEAGEAILRRETDEAGRAVPLGRLIGLQPPGPGGLSAGQAVALRRRNALLRHARAAHPEWRVASDRTAARAMLEALKRYRAGGWQADQKDRPPTAPAGDPVRACWWRICSLGVIIPGTVEGMLAILSE